VAIPSSATVLKSIFNGGTFCPYRRQKSPFFRLCQTMRSISPWAIAQALAGDTGARTQSELSGTHGEICTRGLGRKILAPEGYHLADVKDAAQTRYGIHQNRGDSGGREKKIAHDSITGRLAHASELEEFPPGDHSNRCPTAIDIRAPPPYSLSLCRRAKPWLQDKGGSILAPPLMQAAHVSCPNTSVHGGSTGLALACSQSALPRF